MGLTDLQIKKLSPRDKRYEVPDGKGLFIRVTSTGHKSWIFRYRYGEDQKPRRMTLGNYPSVTLAKAREEHAKALQALENGTDPGAKKQEEKAKFRAEPTFQDLLDEFCEKELSKSPTAKERKRLVEKDALPSWKSLKVSSIKRRHAVLLIDDVRERAPITANRLQGVLVRMFNFAAERGIIDVSPLAGMRRGKEKARARVLTDQEIKLLWKALDLERAEIDIFRLTKLVLKAILLTGQRPGEVSRMTWDQIDGDMWIIPGELRKNDEENRIPITPMMKSLLDQAKPYSGDSKYVFVSPRSSRYSFKKPHRAKPKAEDVPMTPLALSRAISRHWTDMGFDDGTERFTPHDLRRTVRTRLAEIGVSDVLGERILGHKLQGVLGIYNRHNYDIEKRQALMSWERRLREILDLEEAVSNVIPFQSGSG